MEDIQHVFIDEPWDEPAWDYFFTNMGVRKNNFRGHKHLYVYWIKSLRYKVEDMVAVMPSFINWTLCKQRNQSKYEAKVQTPTCVIKVVGELVNVYLEARIQ